MCPVRLVPGLLESFLWYRPGLCQCRFRIGLYLGRSPHLLRLVPYHRQDRSKPAADLLPLSPELVGVGSPHLRRTTAVRVVTEERRVEVGLTHWVGLTYTSVGLTRTCGAPPPYVSSPKSGVLRWG
jgi:hypothetical protein